MAQGSNPIEVALKKAIESDSPKIYCNGFINALGINDITLIVQHNGHTSAVMNMSLITAKSLAIKLTELVQKFETATKSSVPTSDEVAKSLGIDPKSV